MNKSTFQRNTTLPTLAACRKDVCQSPSPYAADPPLQTRSFGLHVRTCSDPGSFRFLWPRSADTIVLAREERARRENGLASRVTFPSGDVHVPIQLALYITRLDCFVYKEVARGNKCRFWQIFVEAIEEFPILSNQKLARVLRNRGYVMLLSNFGEGNTVNPRISWALISNLV